MYDYGNDEAAHPLDVVENFFIAINQPTERINDRELSSLVCGERCAYHANFIYDPRRGLLSIVLSFEIGLHQRDLDEISNRANQIYRLMAQCNQYNHLGHFELWPNEHSVVWRYALLCSAHSRLSDQLIDSALHTGRKACDLFFAAFAQVLWGTQSADDVLNIALAEPMGHA